MSHDDACIFCAIVAGHAEASLVHRDELVTAFLDLHPVVAGHTLVVPNTHVVDATGLDEITAGRMITVGTRIAGAMGAAGIRLEGFNLFFANGAAAGQTVFHSHLHVLPRHRDDGFSIRRVVFGRTHSERAELDALADRLRGALDSQA